jgi:hypothetical protein
MTGLSVKRLNDTGIFRLLDLVSDVDDPTSIFSPQSSYEIVKAVLRFRGLTKILGRRPSQSLKVARYLSNRFDSTCSCGSFSIARGLQRWCPECGKSEIAPSTLLPPIANSDLSSSPYFGFASRERTEIVERFLGLSFRESDHDGLALSRVLPKKTLKIDAASSETG